MRSDRHLSTGLTAAHIAVTGISKSFPDRRVLTDVSFTVHSAERACLVGENGSGKTTLLRILAGIDDDHLGTASVPSPVGFYHQEPPYPREWTLDQVLDDATRTQRAAVENVAAAAERVADGDEGAARDYEHALAVADRTGAWDIDVIVDQVLHGLGLDGIAPQRTAASLSGGEAARLSLAWLLISRPSTLLLDEPTNHLDDRGTDLLISLLRTWKGPVLAASHDRAFVDEIATKILDLDPAPTMHRGAPGDDSPLSGLGITVFTGTLSGHLLAKRAERERWEKQYRDEQRELKRLRGTVDDSRLLGTGSWKPRTEIRMAKKYYADRNAKHTSRRVRDAERDLARLEETQVRKPPPPLTFAGFNSDEEERRETAASAEGPLLVGTQLHIPGRLDPVDLALSATARLLITGENGTGKSSLLGILSGRITEYEGAVTRPRSLRAGELEQNVDLGRYSQDWRSTPVEELYRTAVGDQTAGRLPLSSRGLIAGRDLTRPAGRLSTGQQRRLDLAIVLAAQPELLILDEPTNHFSLALVDELERAIPTFPGAVVIASHDRRLRETWAGERFDLIGASAPRRSARFW